MGVFYRVRCVHTNRDPGLPDGPFLTSNLGTIRNDGLDEAIAISAAILVVTDLIAFRRCCGYRRSPSLREIEAAVKELSREELAKLAAFIARQDKLVWDEELEQDFSPGGKHAAALEKIDAEIGAGNFRPMP